MIFFDKFLSAAALFLILAISYGLDESFRLSSYHTMNRAYNDVLSGVTDDSKTQDLFAFLQGQKPNNGLYIGMFTLHFNPKSLRDDRWINNLIGVPYHSLFLGTFLNSFSERAFVSGVQRNVYMHRFSNTTVFDVGYRLGVISGYDKRMSSFADYSPLVPLVEAYIDFSYNNLGIEVSYIGVVVTAKFFVLF